MVFRISILAVGIGCLIASPFLEGSETSAYLKQKKALEDCSGDDCRVLAESIVKQRRNSMEHSLNVLSRLTDKSLPMLRKLVRDSQNADFHWGAVAALAHMGDSEIVAHLKDRQQQFKQDDDDRSAGLINHYLWKIDVQQSSKSLLAYIAEKPGVRAEERLWAIQRAHDLAIPKADIRKAILDHAALVAVDKHGIRPGLSSIKRTGILLGILTENDLPSVKLSRDLSEVLSE